MIRLQNTMVNSIASKAGAGLIDQHNAVKHHRYILKLLGLLQHDGHGHLCLAKPRGGIKQLASVAVFEALCELLHNI